MTQSASTTRCHSASLSDVSLRRTRLASVGGGASLAHFDGQRIDASAPWSVVQGTFPANHVLM